MSAIWPASRLPASFRAEDRRVGVLAVDPSSPFSGGALLGDRVRMQEHATDPGVYIRSRATRGHLGGLAWATPQALRVLDAAGCDVVLVETVGVGQSEVEVAALADTTVVLLAPGMVARWRARGVPPGVAEALAVPVAAHVVTAPVIAGLSGEVSLVAVVANLLAAPVIAPATVLGVLAAAAAPLRPAWRDGGPAPRPQPDPRPRRRALRSEPFDPDPRDLHRLLRVQQIGIGHDDAVQDRRLGVVADARSGSRTAAANDRLWG